VTFFIKVFDRRIKEDSKSYWFLAVRYASILEHNSRTTEKDKIINLGQRQITMPKENFAKQAGRQFTLFLVACS